MYRDWVVAWYGVKMYPANRHALSIERLLLREKDGSNILRPGNNFLYMPWGRNGTTNMTRNEHSQARNRGLAKKGCPLI